jgi:hypothetical protein
MGFLFCPRSLVSGQYAVGVDALSKNRQPHLMEPTRYLGQAGRHE